MEAHPLSITPELRQAISTSGGLPVQLFDPDTKKLYLLFEQSAESSLDEGYIHEALNEGITALETGERIPWNPEQIKKDGRSRLDRQKAHE